MEQTPESTEYDGMPRTAISTGLVGFVLPLAEMPAQLMAYVAHAFRKISRPISSQIPPKADDSHPGLEPGSGKDSMAGVKPRQWR